MCICTGDCSVHVHRCNEGASSYAVCGMNATMDYNATSNSNNMTQSPLFIPGTDVLEQLDVTIPFYGLYLLLIAVGLVFRVLAYFALRFLHRKHQ